MASQATDIVKVNGVKLKGTSLDGEYPVVRVDEAEGKVVIAHPEHGNVRVPRERCAFPASTPVTLSYDELVAEIKDRFETLERLVKGVIDGNQRSIIVSGAPGTGKTWTVESMLDKAQSYGLVRKVTTVRGTISPIAFYQLLHSNRRPGDVIVLDDADGLFQSDDGLNLIKAATDTGKKRVVSYLREAHALQANGVPQSFEHEGALIIATNVDVFAEAEAKTKMSAHMAAIVNRALCLDLGMRSTQALLARVEYVVRNTPMLRDEGLEDAEVEQVIDWLKSNSINVRSLSLRTALRLAGLMRSEPETWKKTAKATLLRAASR